MGKFIRVDMTSKEVKIGECPEKYAGLAGRALTSNFVADEVKPTCHPLGKNNKLIFAPGFLSGTNAANSGRLSCGAKSPLTGGIKESNTGAAPLVKRWPEWASKHLRSREFQQRTSFSSSMSRQMV